MLKFEVNHGRVNHEYNGDRPVLISEINCFIVFSIRR